MMTVYLYLKNSTDQSHRKNPMEPMTSDWIPLRLLDFVVQHSLSGDLDNQRPGDNKLSSTVLS